MTEDIASKNMLYSCVEGIAAPITLWDCPKSKLRQSDVMIGDVINSLRGILSHGVSFGKAGRTKNAIARIGK